MKIGTRSLLFGVHCFWIHPIVVALAWKKIHGRWPRDRAEWFAIVFHDWGYWGMPNIDGPEGQMHPLISASLMWPLLEDSPRLQTKVTHLILGHSRYYCARTRFIKLSALYAPDKVSILYEPRWFYLLRGTLSGEISEYIQNAPAEFHKGPFRSWHWLNWYRDKVRKQFKV